MTAHGAFDLPQGRFDFRACFYYRICAGAKEKACILAEPEMQAGVLQGEISEN